MRRPSRLVALAALLLAGSAHGQTAHTVGVIAPQGDADAAEALRGVADGLRRGPAPRPALVERTVLPGETAIAAALAEMRIEKVDLIVALADAATVQVRDSLRDLPGVFAAADAAMAGELRGGGNACVTAGVGPATLVADLRRAAPGLRRVGVFVPAGDEAARTNARDLGGEADVVVAEAEGGTPEARAAAAVAKLIPGTDAVWLPPSVTSADAAALARAMERSGVPLVGSRQSHLAAGCAVVVRSDPHDLGAFAAVMAREVLAGADPAKMNVRRTRRRLLDVNLPAAKRLGYSVPLTLLAWADSVVRPWAVKR